MLLIKGNTVGIVVVNGDRAAVVFPRQIAALKDLLATGGTVSAVVKLVEGLGAEIVECAFMAELDFLEGRKKLPEGKVFSLLNF